MEQVNLDLKNKRILYELEQDSRQSLQKIAKKVKLSKEAVFHRIKNLEKSGIIKQYIAEIDIYKLGYQYYPILLKLHNTSHVIDQDILSYLKKSKYVAWLTTCEGNWDINLTILAKNDFDLNNFLEDFLSKFGHYIVDKQVFTTTEIHYFKRGFWLNKPTTQTISTGGEKEIDLAKKDFELLKILTENSRKPLIEIADQLKISAKAIAYKIRKLEKNKIIQGSRILVEFSKLNYKFYKVFFSLKNMNKTNWKKLFSYFQLKPNIIWATKLIGTYDLSIEMEVKSVAEFRDIITEIKEKYPELITKHESLLIFEELVLNYLPKV